MWLVKCTVTKTYMCRMHTEILKVKDINVYIGPILLLNGLLTGY